MNEEPVMLQGELEPIALREELISEMSMPTLTVHVDFNDLYASEGETATFEILGKLKDLLA